jgi:CDP-6-deoxy-D-xylo-4-hexulose-3-dehydrase
LTAQGPFRYPCTGHIEHAGFGAFLEAELGEPRANLRRFARELREHFGAERVTLVNSGSSANLAAAFALAEQTGRGHAIASGFTFPTTIAALLAAGYEVSLVDTEPEGFNADLSAIEDAIRPSTRVICLSHFLGFPARIDDVHELAARRGLLVLQDCCESLDLRVSGGPAHRRGTLATWSFYHPRHLSAYGGGAVLSPDDSWHRRVESLSHWGRACTCHTDGLECVAPPGLDHRFWYERAGFNLEMSELNACFGRFQLRSYRVQEDRRRRHYHTLYNALFDHPSLRVWAAPEDTGSPFVFPINVREGDPEDITARLMAWGVEARSLMPAVASWQPAFRDLPHDGLQWCTSLAATTFFVGIHQTLREEEVAEIGRLIDEAATQ